MTDDMDTSERVDTALHLAKSTSASQRELGAQMLEKMALQLSSAV